MPTKSILLHSIQVKNFVALFQDPIGIQEGKFTTYRNCDLTFIFSSIDQAEGCVCEQGYYRNNGGVCVAKSNCGCYDETGLIMTAGDGHYEGQNFCKCQSGVIKCQFRKLVDDGYNDQARVN